MAKGLIAMIAGWLRPKEPARKPFTVILPNGEKHRFTHKPKLRRRLNRWLTDFTGAVLLGLLATAGNAIDFDVEGVSNKVSGSTVTAYIAGGSSNIGTVSGSTVSVTGTVIIRSTGTWAYKASVLTSGSLAGTGRCKAIIVMNTSSDTSATLNISGGDTITLPPGLGFADSSCGEQVTAPVINWLSGSFSAVVTGTQ